MSVAIEHIRDEKPNWLTVRFARGEGRARDLLVGVVSAGVKLESVKG
jgi:hypothetical protein